jgi:hypothetical protein
VTRAERDARARRILAALFLLSLPFVNPYVRGDGNGYYAYLPSIVIDKDLDFENQFRHADPLFRELYFDEQGALRPSMRSPTGRVVNQWAVGPALLWLPFFLLAHGLVIAASWVSGAAVAADGYAAPYRWFCALATAGYGWLAVRLAYRVAARSVGAEAALVGALAVWGASSLPVYMYFLPFHVHALAAFAVALFVWYGWRAEAFGWAPARWALWGALAGLMTEVYYLNALVAILALLELLRQAVPPQASPVRPRVMAATAFATGLAVALIPHFVVKTLLHGSPLSTGYHDEFFWTSPRLWQVGFAAEHGLFSWTPVVAIAVAGLALAARRDPWRAGTVLVVFALFYYAVASYQNWHGQSSFGNRFFVSLTVFFVLGVSAVVAWVEARTTARRLAPRLVCGALLLLVLWNAGFIFQWGTDIVPNRGPVEFATVARNQVRLVPARAGRFLWRYFADRAGVTAEVERRDAIERERYRLKR